MFRKLFFLLTLIISLILLNVFVGVVQAQETELPMLTKPGSYGVGLASMTFIDKRREDWTLKAVIWYPADKAKGTAVSSGSLVVKDAPPDTSGAPYPLIIYSHWMSGSRAELSPVMEHLAPQGYVVAAAQHHDTWPVRFELVDRPLDILLLLDSLAAITEGDLAGMIDTGNVGLIGYSQGAETVLQMLGLLRDPVHFASWCAKHPELKTSDCIMPADMGQWPFEEIANYRTQLGFEDTPDGQWVSFGDERIHAVFAMAPGDFPLTTEDMLASVTTPTMILHGTKDTTCDYEGNAVRTYTHLGTQDRYLVTWVNGGHMNFSLMQELPKHFATAFFGHYLKGDQTYAPYLTAEHMTAELLAAWGFPKLFWGPYEGE